jgi:uridine phosphorylase
MPIHLRPSAPIAPQALLPGDPGRALALAQALLIGPRMSNHHRGLWGYSGRTTDGLELTIQSTGMGGPSAAIVLAELAELGLRRAIRVGTCGALDPGLGLGELLLVEAAIATDGVSARLRSSRLASPDPALQRRLAEAGGARAVTVVTTDLFYEPGFQPPRGARAVEMEAAPLFALGGHLGLQLGCLLVVSDVYDEGGERRRIGDEALLAASEELGRIAVAALG